MLLDASFSLDSCDLDLVAALREELACTETLAWLLARRGITPQQARELIDEDPVAEQAQLHDPMLLGDMAAAVERITYAIEQGEQIVVHGDYDADGVCATTLIVEGLEQMGAQVTAFLPDRFTNGYGLQLDQVERFAQGGARLLIAVDCGITAVEPVAHARELGLDTIICDHHTPGEQLPDAILCSTRPSDYPFPELCATGVVGKLLLALGGPSGPAQHELEAIATIADCVPLVDENRVLVRRGLRALRSTTRPGLRALAEQCGLRTREIDADAIAFKLAPRINAVGRISQSERAYELLRSAPEDAARLAAKVDETNEQRRAIEREITAEAIEQVEAWSEAQRASRIYVVAGMGWHEGVVGIVASRLVERYSRPVIVIAGGDPGRGSGRSVDGVNLYAALAASADLLLRWGGHSQAGGLAVDSANLDALRARLRAWGDANIPDELLSPRDRIDAIVPAKELTHELVQELDRLAPFGTGWVRPTLLATSAQVDGMKGVGGDGTHLRCTIVVGQQRVPAIGFGLAPLIPELLERRVDVALRPSINRFRGAETLQVELQRFYPIEEPPGSDVIAGWCASGCSHASADQVTMEQLLAAATGLVAPEISDADPDLPPPIESMLARSNTLDLRHRDIGHEHIAQLLAAGRSVLVVVADMPRRRDLFRAMSTNVRFGVTAALAASEHSAPLAIGAELYRMASIEQPGAKLVLADHAALEHVLSGPLNFDVIAVLDPPTTVGARDRITGVDADVSLHLLFGANEQRFSADALRSALDVRGTLADAWRLLRDSGPASSAELRAVLFGAGEHPRSPSAIVHGLHTLLDRGLLELDADAQLRIVVAQEPVATAAP
ncbi:MAG: single-stranded-DNA-specific exonuclease RecJ [Gaiellales bacterium]